MYMEFPKILITGCQDIDKKHTKRTDGGPTTNQWTGVMIT